MRLRARDKVEEAAFFLKQVQRHSKHAKKFRWCLSALVAALRSVSNVLQKDLRGEHGEAFNTWWQTEALSLTKLPLARTLNELRNVTQKEGNRLPELRLQFDDPDQPGRRLTLRYDVSKEDLIEIELETAGAIGPVTLPDLPVEDDLEVVCRILNCSGPEIIKMIHTFLSSIEPSVRIVIDDRGTILSIDEFVGRVQEHLVYLRALVARAEKQFPPPHDFPL